MNIKVARILTPKVFRPDFIKAKDIRKITPDDVLNRFKDRATVVSNKFSSQDILCVSVERGEGKAPDIYQFVDGKFNNRVAHREKDGAKKISEKKNWGTSSKGVAADFIPLDNFCETGIINNYKIACFLIRDEKIYSYGETSFIKDYSYIYEKLLNWIVDKLNNQTDDGPTENLNSYLDFDDKISRMLFSIGATRYTEFGKNNFLQENDKSVVILYPADKYTDEEIINIVKNKDFSHKDISMLYQEIMIK